jgi:GTP-binding protein YchF
MLHVVRCFNEAAGEVAPRRDIDALETELIVADMQVAESALDRATRPAQAGDADAKARCNVLNKALAVLNEGRRIRSVTNWTDAERAILHNYGFISAKPQLLVANIAEEDIAAEGDAAAEVRACAEALGGEAVVVCGKLEAELAELEEADRAEMLEGLGIEEAAIGRLARAAFRLLGLASFYTTSPKEIRAWTIPVGATAPEAAGAVHSDMQRGFIRAECYSVDDLEQYKSEKALREAGRLRSEGKHYQMEDGDVAKFLFNV